MSRELIRTYYVIKGENDGPAYLQVRGATKDRKYALKYSSWNHALNGMAEAWRSLDRAHVVEVKVYKKRRPTVEELVKDGLVNGRRVTAGTYYTLDIRELRDALRPYFP